MGTLEEDTGDTEQDDNGALLEEAGQRLAQLLEEDPQEEIHMG